MTPQLPEDVPSSVDPLDLRAASRDLWPGGTLDFVQGVAAPEPDRVFLPRDAGEVARVLRWAAEAGVPVVTYGAGSGVCGGARGMAGSVVLDTKGLDRIGPLDRDRWTVDVEPGVLGQHLEDWLAARGFTLGHSPSSIWCSTVGGWVAARSAGQLSGRYGVIEDMVLRIEAVSPARGRFVVGDGGDAPEAWWPMLIGSEGTLAVITRVRFRVWPAPASRWLRGYAFDDLPTAVRAMRRLVQAELWPAVIRLYDPVDTRVGGRTKSKDAPEHAPKESDGWLARMLDAVDARRALALPLALPGLVNRLFDAAASGCLLIVGFEGDPGVVDAASRAASALLADEGATDLGDGPGERWWRSRHHVSYKLIPIFEAGGFADTMEVACTWARLVPLYHAVRKAIGHTAIVMAHMSHVYPEGGSIYFSFAGRGDRRAYDATWRAALEAVLAAGGTITHHHGVGVLKAAAAAAEVGPAIVGWHDARAALDPTGTMNPGRLFVEGDPRDPPVDRLDPAVDGLVLVPAEASYDERQSAATSVLGELMWPWRTLPAPQPWARMPWQSGPMEVRARVGGRPCVLGRGPRSATGPDLRPWLLERGTNREVTLAVAASGERWMAEGVVAQPWSVAQELLRADLRPAVLTVVDGRLRVGFRGPAAAAMGALARARVPELEQVPYTATASPGGPLVACALDDPNVIWVTTNSAFRVPPMEPEEPILPSVGAEDP